MDDGLIYHMCTRAEWERGRLVGRYAGSTQDPGSTQNGADGFIHFSTAAQVAASAAKHRAGQDDLVLIEVQAAALGPALRWEISRGGDRFPHLYGSVSLLAVTRGAELPLGPDGQHIFPWSLGAGA